MSGFSLYKISYTLSDDDYYDFNKYYVLSIPQQRRQLRAFRFGFPSISLVIMFIAIRSIWSSPHIYFIYAIIAGLSLAWIIAFSRIIDFSMRRQIAKMKKQGKVVYDKSVALAFGESSFAEKTPESEAVIQYTMLERIAETDKAIYLFARANMAYIVPKRAFVSETEAAGFGEFIRSKVPTLEK